MHGTSTFRGGQWKSISWPSFFFFCQICCSKVVVWTADISYRVRWYIDDCLIVSIRFLRLILSMVNGRAGRSRIGTLLSLYPVRREATGQLVSSRMYHLCVTWKIWIFCFVKFPVVLVNMLINLETHRFYRILFRFRISTCVPIDYVNFFFAWNQVSLEWNSFVRNVKQMPGFDKTKI